MSKSLRSRANASHREDSDTYIPEIVGALNDGAHNGGGQNGQDAYSGRIIAPHSLSSHQQVGEGNGRSIGGRMPKSDTDRGFL